MDTKPEKNSAQQLSARAHFGQRAMRCVHKNGSTTRYDQTMIFVLSHSHGANFTKQQSTNAPTAGKTNSAGPTGRLPRPIATPSRTTKTGSTPKFSGQKNIAA